MPDSINILEMSKLFNVSTDYLLNDEYQSDDDLPKIKTLKKDNIILRANLTRIAIILQATLLNLAIQPIAETGIKNFTIIVLVIKLSLLLLSSLWMIHNLKYENNIIQHKKNVKIELAYCLIQLIVALFGFYSKNYFITATIIFIVAMYYILVINPKYMKCQLVRKINK